MSKIVIDVVDIKTAVKQGQLSSYVKDNIIYLKNEAGEVVEIGRVETTDKEKRLP